MTATLPEFAEKFRLDELTVLRTEHWTWSVRPVQTTVGAGILSLNRFATALGDLREEEGAELSRITAMIEERLRAFSTPDKMNYLALMMVDAHVHFHVIPRYAEPRALVGHEWLDGGWPGPPALSDNATLSTPGTLRAIRDVLRDDPPSPAA